MTSKERMLATLSFTEPDQVCVDFGSSVLTGMHVRAVALLRAHYGLEKRPVKVVDPYQRSFQKATAVPRPAPVCRLAGIFLTPLCDSHPLMRAN